MDEKSGNKKRLLQIVLSTLVLVGITSGFVILGALGPKSSKGAYHAMYTCIVKDARDHIRNPTAQFVDEKSCHKLGRKMVVEEEERTKLKHYPLENIVFYTQIPHFKEQVMSREFEFLLADLGVHFTSSDYIKEAVERGDNVVKFEVALGYRDAIKGAWSRKVAGNVTRTVTCSHRESAQGIFMCEHFPLFELGSCHHKQYVVNLYFTHLPLMDREQYSGLAQLHKLSLYEIHQSRQFTRQWLVLKTIFCPLALLFTLWFLVRLRGVATGSERRDSSLIERFLAFLGLSLVFYNAPFQYLSLYFDLPWLLVVNDFQQGLFIAALFSFWIIFVSEHQPNTEGKSHIGSYWKQMGVVFVASIFLFIYEFCERGIQVVFPFYSLWGSNFGVAIAWTFVGIASTSALLYLITFLVTLVRVLREIRRKQKELSSLSSSAQEKFSGLFASLWFFLVVTCIVATCSILTVVLPSEALLHHWQHKATDYNVYSGILTGNYGMWNAYCLLMMLMYAPSVTKTTTSADSADNEDLQKLLHKSSQN